MPLQVLIYLFGLLTCRNLCSIQTYTGFDITEGERVLRACCNFFGSQCQWNILVSSMGFSSSQNPLIQPTVGPDVSGTVTTELLQSLSEIVAEDTNNILVQVLKIAGIILFCTTFVVGVETPCHVTCRPVARIFRRGVTWRSDVYAMHKHAWKTREVWGHASRGNFLDIIALRPT